MRLVPLILRSPQSFRDGLRASRRARKLLPALALTLLLALILACGDDDDGAGASPSASAETSASATTTPEPAKVTFMAGFKPQANLPFVGAYIAQEKGFFAEENLEVDIQHVTTPGDNFRLLALGEVQFSTSDATALLEKWTGDPVLEIVSLALIGRTGQQGFAVLEESGIETPADWAGKRAGYKGSDVTPDYLAILEANGVDPSSIETVRVGFEPQVLTEGQVDIFPVFLSNEPDTLLRLGYETKVFTAADYGAPTLGLTYVTSADYLAEHSDVADRFVRAALRGVLYASAHPDEAIEITLKYAPQENAAHQRFMLDTELAMATANLVRGDRIGCQTAEQWQALHDYLVRFNGLPRPVEDISQVFTGEFVECAAAAPSAAR